MRTIAFILISLSSAAAQTLPDADKLMKQATEATAKFHTLQYDADSTTELGDPGASMKIKSEGSWAVENPGKTRVETKAQGMVFEMVSDGNSTWLYASMNKQYTRIPAAMGAGGVMAGMGMKLPDVAHMPKTMKVLREESLEIDGAKHDCWVVETRIGDMDIPIPQMPKMNAEMTDAVTTAWIDKKTFIDLQTTMSMNVAAAGMPPKAVRVQTTKKNIKIDQPIADSVFTFTPPPDAKEVKELSLFGGMMNKADLAGKDAPAFELKGLDLKSYSLASLKGKPVLLDFWATWCAPCRASMPAVEKVYKQYHDQGLVVLAVNTGEDRETVEAFLKKTPFAYPAVLSGDSGIMSAYQVTVFPTFVLIGSDGKIVDNEMGYGGEATLTDMLSKAGLKPAPAK